MAAGSDSVDGAAGLLFAVGVFSHSFTSRGPRGAVAGSSACPQERKP